MSAEESIALNNIMSSYVSTVSGSDVITVTPSTGEGDVTISHAIAAASGTFGATSSQTTPGFGETFTVPRLEFNSTGHLQSATEYSITIPSNTADTTHNGLMSY